MSALELGPHPRVKARIARAVDAAISEVDSNSRGLTACFYYAVAGAMAASVLTGRNYIPQIGKLVAPIGKDNEMALEMDPAKTGYCGLEFHAWFVRNPGGKPGETVQLPPARMEVVDLSLRHYPEQVRRRGFDWQWENWPDFFWGSMEQLRRRYGVMLTPDPTISRQMFQNEQAINQAGRMARRAVGIAKNGGAMTGSDA